MNRYSIEFLISFVLYILRVETIRYNKHGAHRSGAELINAGFWAISLVKSSAKVLHWLRSTSNINMDIL